MWSLNCAQCVSAMSSGGLELLTINLQQMNIESTDLTATDNTAITYERLLAAGWIPVKEKMPPQVTPVLVFGCCCDGCYNIIIAEYEVAGWWESYHGSDLHFEPEFWMPLPFPSACS